MHIACDPDEFGVVSQLREHGGAYLASNTMGVIPRSAIDAEYQSLLEQNASGIQIWDRGIWSACLQRYQAVIARYLDVQPHQVCPVTNITDGLWRVFSCFDFTKSRRTILQTAMEFTTQVYAGFGMQQMGASVVVAPSDALHHTVPTDQLIALLHQHRPVALNLSHAAFESSYLHDLQAISAACRETETVFCLDAAQTGFVLPLTLRDAGADVILLQQHKWGCGGTGAACLVVSDEFCTRYQPSLVGWMSHAEPFQFERGPARLAPNASRFLGGTPDVPAKVRGAVAAELIIDTLGIQAVYKHNKKLVQQLLVGLESTRFRPIHVQPRAGFIAVQCRDAAEAHSVESQLRDAHFVIDSRGSRLRIGPHFYNTEEDITRFIEAIGRLDF